MLDTTIPKSKPAHLFEEIFLHSWWVILFIIICFMFYEQGQKRRKEDFEIFRGQVTDLQTQINNEKDSQQTLTMQINSQSDPAWVELTLMKGLGLVPEGQTKVYFSHD